MKTNHPSCRNRSAARASLRAMDILHDPYLNKGTAFTEAERKRFGLLGLLPPQVCTIEEQVQRVLENFRRVPDGLGQYIMLTALQDRNKTLFYRVVMDNIEETMPVIYTPVVGQACQVYGHIFRQPKGLYVSRDYCGHVKTILRNWPGRDIRVIVVTDGERILGLGDLGANGMGIPVGKLSLYTACAGIPPDQTLPVVLDVGTNNESLLKDPLYLGIRRKRIGGAEYDAFVDEFIRAAREVFPKALIQFEDFANHNAFRLLDKYRREICTFNDDIQGTAAVTLAGLYSALRVTDGKLKDQTILFLGAGEAATGIADLCVSAAVAEGADREAARRRCWFVDSKGLVEAGRTDLAPHKKNYAHRHAPLKDLLAAVRSVKPAILIGASGQPKAFTREIVAEMARINRRPVVFALSNPTSKAECSAQEAYDWSDGRAIFASGSPFPPHTHRGRTLVPGQANNAYVFPGIGLGVAVSEAKRVTDEMFFAAAKTLAEMTSSKDLAQGRLFPALAHIREISARIAAAVADVVYKRGLTSQPRPRHLLEHIRKAQYQPVYGKLAKR
ncbi:MAG: NAD-dependent malic enzyme [Elusimicrobia bacterium]|nr:NAD-dependent malic enzyme [Elusimicrobiota bacterium]